MIRNIIRSEDAFLTSSQAAEFLNVSVSTLKKLLYLKKVKTLKTPGGHQRIRKSDLLAIMDSN